MRAVSVTELIPRRSGASALLLLVITVFAGTLRLRGLGNDSLWLDEAVTWAQTRNGVIDAIVQTSRDTYPPGYNIFAAMAVSLLGEAEWVLRLPAAIFGTLAVPAAYWLGRLSAGRLAGFVAALLIALSTFALYYSQEARMYSLLMLAATLTTTSTIAYLAKPSLGRGIAIVASATLLFYSHPYGALSWASLGGMSVLVLLARRAGARAILGSVVAFGAALLLFTPWLFVTLRVATRLQDRGFWISRPSWTTPFDVLAQVSGTWLQFLFVAVGALLSLLYWLRRVEPQPDGVTPVAKSISAPILLASAFGPLLAGFVISLLTTPVFIPRYVICCLPALMVLVAIGYSQLAATSRLGLIGVCVLLSVWLGIAPAEDETSKRGQDTRALVAELNYAMQPGDCLLVTQSFHRGTLDYYLKDQPACDLTGSDGPAAIAAALPPQARLFLVVVNVPGPEVEGLRELLGGTWSRDRYFGGAMRLAVREPTP